MTNCNLEFTCSIYRYAAAAPTKARETSALTDIKQNRVYDELLLSVATFLFYLAMNIAVTGGIQRIAKTMIKSGQQMFLSLLRARTHMLQRATHSHNE